MPDSEASRAVSATFLDRVAEVATELEGDAAALIESLRTRSDERLGGFRENKADDLETYLTDQGYLDTRPVLGEAEIHARALASPAASRLPGRTAAECVHRWWTLSGS